MGRTYFNSGLDTMMANKYQEPLYFADIHLTMKIMEKEHCQLFAQLMRAIENSS